MLRMRSCLTRSQLNSGVRATTDIACGTDRPGKDCFMGQRAFDYRRLSIAERLQLVEDIWDSIAEESPDAVPLTEAQRAELDRREAEHQRDPAAAVPWEQVRAELFRRGGE
jgi:putative addiction module component (TIGR02574 family)